MTPEQTSCLFGILKEILEASGGGGATDSTRGVGGTTIPVGAKEFGYTAVGGTITVGGVTIPEGLSASEATPGGREATVTIADGSGVAHWYYTS